MMYSSKQKINLAVIFSTFLLIGIVVGANVGFKSIGFGHPEKVAIFDSPDRASVTGEYVCLPHKDAAGPQTAECAIGIRTQDGSYYALDFNLMSQTKPEFKTGDRFSANGIITPVEALSAEYWTKNYNIKGIFSVTDSVNVIK